MKELKDVCPVCKGPLDVVEFENGRPPHHGQTFLCGLMRTRKGEDDKWTEWKLIPESRCKNAQEVALKLLEEQ